MHDGLVRGKVDGSRQHLWIDFLKTIILPESVADSSIFLLVQCGCDGRVSEICFKETHHVEDGTALCVSGGADK